MNVNELIAKLKALPGDMEIFVARDEEGNGFRPLYEVEVSHYHKGWDEAIHPDDYADPDNEYVDDDQVIQAVVIWP